MPDGRYVVRLRGGTPPTYQLLCVHVHHGGPYKWPQVLALNQMTIRFYYPRSKQARKVSLDSIYAIEKPTTQE